MKQVLFLLHGIGNHAGSIQGEADSAEWAVDVEKALREALKGFPKVSAESLEIVPILYDDVFHSHVTRWAALAESLLGTPFESIVGWMSEAGNQDFLWGNLGDVVLYRALPLVREHVLTHVATQLADKIKERGNADVEFSVLAHSLGTAVAHDAIQKLSTTGINGNTALRPPGFRFKSFTALANVSRLVWATDDAFYRETRVRPPDCGLSSNDCAVQNYATYRHVADPVPSIVRFTRKTWPPSVFWSRDLDHCHETNVHAFTHYLAHPKVTNQLFFRLFGDKAISVSEMNAQNAKFRPYLDEDSTGVRASAVKTMTDILDRLSLGARGTFTENFRALITAVVEAKAKGVL